MPKRDQLGNFELMVILVPYAPRLHFPMSGCVKAGQETCVHPVKGRVVVDAAVEPRRNPVSRLQHIPGDLSLHGINLIHQVWRTVDATEEDGSGEEPNDEPAPIFHFRIQSRRIIKPHK
jgi:hypothetical protein